MNTTADQYLTNLSAVKDISAKVKALQVQLGLPELKKKQAELKEQLYEYMDSNGLDEFKGIKITAVMPGDVKKQIRVDGKKELIADIIGDKLDESELDDIIDKLATI